MVIFTFAVLDQKYHFWANLVPKFYEFNDSVQFFRFRPKIPFSGKFGQKIKIGRLSLNLLLILSLYSQLQLLRTVIFRLEITLSF